MENIYKTTLMKNYTFKTVNGTVSVADLFQLPLKSNSADRPCLNSTAKIINSELKNLEEEDFVQTGKNTSKRDELTLKLDIVKDVIKTKEEELDTKTHAMEIRRENELIDRLIEEKKLENLKNMSMEELKKRKRSV